MLDKIIATFCIPDDLLHILHHRNDPQAKITDSEILTIAILACQEFGGNMRKALQWVKALQLFSFVPSESRFNRRLHRLVPLIHAMWQHLEPCTAYALDTFRCLCARIFALTVVGLRLTRRFGATSPLTAAIFTG
jgi:hypothetical protein